MDTRRDGDTFPTENRTAVQRASDRELVVTRVFDAPVRTVFDAWTRPELIERWWVPKSAGMTLLSCQAEVRVGGGYRFEFGHGDSQRMAFFGRYLEATPPSRLVWTNEESDAGAVTTVTFEERGGKTMFVLMERYPSKEALDDAFAGMEGAACEQYEQLDELLVALGAKSERQ